MIPEGGKLGQRSRTEQEIKIKSTTAAAAAETQSDQTATEDNMSCKTCCLLEPV